MLFKKKAKQKLDRLLGGLDLDAFGKKLEGALADFDWGEDEAGDPAQTIVEDYFRLIKAMHGKGKPARVVLSPEDPGFVSVDGQEYDLYSIPRRDAVNTERRMEIEALLADGTASVEEIQKRLNEKIQTDW